jgi:GNAT superfamily N-acetyltransferase
MNINTRPSELRARRRTSTPHIELRLARKEDAVKIAPFLGAFFARSRWSETLTFHEGKALDYLERVIGSGYAPYVLALDGDELVGVCSYHTYDVFTDPIAVMDETYALPRYRRTDLGRRLVGLAIEMARAEGCKAINFPIASGMPEQNSLMNMVGRHFGAEYIGMIFRKGL